MNPLAIDLEVSINIQMLSVLYSNQLNYNTLEFIFSIVSIKGSESVYVVLSYYSESNRNQCDFFDIHHQKKAL